MERLKSRGIEFTYVFDQFAKSRLATNEAFRTTNYIVTIRQ
jgi:hypothetical protein